MGVSLGTLLFLAIDPTVAAHLPVVMTDLPVALLSTTAVVLAARAFREWVWTDLVACSAFLGLALTAKISAPVILLSVQTLIGAAFAMLQPLPSPKDSRWPKFLKLAPVLGGAMVVLWASDFFRYAESPSGVESFNRPLAEKINDVASPRYHAVLATMAATHVVPRAISGFLRHHSCGNGGPGESVLTGQLDNRFGHRIFIGAMHRFVALRCTPLIYQPTRLPFAHPMLVAHVLDRRPTPLGA